MILAMSVRTFASIDELRLAVGQEVATTQWHTVTQQQINTFADATGDQQWIHTDVARASVESPYKSTIAHGFLTLSLLSELSREAVEIQEPFRHRINYGINRLRFPAAVRAGVRVRGRFTLKAVEDVENGVQVVWDCRVEIENEPKPALVAEWLTRLYK